MSSAPLSRAALLSLAKQHFSLPENVTNRLVPDQYLEELERHVILYPNDTRFLINIEPGYGLGYVTCLETGCNRNTIDLLARIDLPDGGLARGFGSLSSYRAHAANNSAAHGRANNIVLVRPKIEPPTDLAFSSSASRRSSLFDIIDARVPSSSAAITTKRELSDVKIEDTGSFIFRKRLSDSFKTEDQSPPKKLKLETSKMPLAFVTNSPSPSPTCSTAQAASDIRIKLSEIQSQIISYRRLLDNVQRKAQKSAADRTRESRYLAVLRSYEAEKIRLGISLPASSATRDLERKPSITMATVSPSLQFPATAERRYLTNSPPFPISPPQQPVASGSNVVLNAPPSNEPMNVDPIMPMCFTAKADEINQFLLAAGNAAFFDGEATVERSLASLGLKDLFTTLPGMNVALMSHQVLALDWMIEQEKKLKMQGGILADEMGLGKTVQIIALMIKNKSKNPMCKMNLVVAPLALLDQWQLEIETKTDCGIKCYIHHGQGKLKKKSDIEQYDVVLTTYGTLTAEWPDPEPEKKKQSFIVNGVDGFVKSNSKKKARGLLFDIEWYRVILDEGHIIRNRRTLASRAVVELDSTYRWCLSGTPIINGLADAYGLLRFLRIRPWDDWKEFNSQITLIEKRRPDLATSRLQSIFRTMLLRRKKDTLLGGKRLIELPPKEINLVKLQFSQEERDIYTMVETKSQIAFNKFLRAGTVLKNYTQVLVLLLRLRQICNHPVLITDDNAEHTDSLLDEANVVSEYDRALRLVGPEFVAKMNAKLMRLATERMEAEKRSADAILDEECPICFDFSTDSVVCTCTHIFCRECIVNVLNTTEPKDDIEGAKYKANERPCPVCRSPISREMLFARKAFEPAYLESIAEDPVRGDCEPRGKGTMKKSDHIHISNLDEPNYDDLSGFIVPDDDDDFRPVPKKGSWKGRRNIISDSDDEDEYDDVIIGATKNTEPTVMTPSMSEHEISTKMKVQQMLAFLERWKLEHPDEKVIIISQWTRYLEIVSRYLTSKGFVHVQYQGSMSRNERNRAVRALMKKDSKVSIMLMSLKCGGVGLNLTRANRVISLDLSWSSAVEGQSFDRVHRLGQNKTVFVERLVIADTVEDRILALQERKKSLSDGSLGEGNGKKIGRLSVKELASLFGLDHRGRAL